MADSPFGEEPHVQIAELIICLSSEHTMSLVPLGHTATYYVKAHLMVYFHFFHFSLHPRSPFPDAPPQRHPL